jgi:tetratricopeptide (TPR) repeat protein
MSAGAKPYCPECGKPATGNFCQSCGAKLGGRFCNQCGAKAAPAAAFCNQCGSKVDGAVSGRRAAAAAAVGGNNLPWWIAGVTMFAMIVVLGVRMVQPGPAAAPAPAGAPAAGGLSGPAPDISNMTPRQRADALFDRVMRYATQGDSASMRAFMPMALAAHDQARPLDTDGLYHLAALNQTANNLEAAIAVSEEILATEPNHILALGVAGDAAAELGRREEAEAYFTRLIEAYPQEESRPLPEYEGHQPSMQVARSAAQAFLAAR